MAGHKNFKVARNNRNHIYDIYEKKNSPNKTTEILGKDERIRKGLKIWIYYWRQNIHRFALEYLGIQVYMFQMILLFLMDKSMFFMYIAARGQGKSYLIAIYCVCRCILYPNTQICIASGTKGQAGLIITEKIQKILYNNYPNVAREIKDIKTGKTDMKVVFQNGSTIEAVTSSENARG